MTSGQAWETVVTKWKGSIGEKRVNDILADQLNGGFDTGETTLAQASELWNSKLSNGKTFSSEYGYLWEGGLGEIEKRIVQGQKEKLDRAQQERDNIVKGQIEEIRQLEQELKRPLNIAELTALKESGKMQFPQNKQWGTYINETLQYNKDAKLDELRAWWGEYGFLKPEQVQNFTQDELQKAIPGYVAPADVDEKTYARQREILDRSIESYFALSGLEKHQYPAELMTTQDRAWEDWVEKYKTNIAAGPNEYQQQRKLELISRSS